jgi:hypothetical protein
MLALGCSSVWQRSGIARPWQTTERITTQKLFQSALVSSARCTMWPCFLQLLHRPEHQQAVEAFGVDPAIVEPMAAASLPARGQAMDHRELGLLVVETDGLAGQQHRDHPAQQNQIALVADRAVSTKEAGELNMQLDLIIHVGLDWCENPKLSRLPAYQMA